MRNVEAWQETKFERVSPGRWRAGRRNVPFTSRLVVDLAAEAYSQAIAVHAVGRLADLGCGRVPLFGMYREHVTEVVCVDWPGSLQGSEYVDHFHDLNVPLELEPGTFDTIIATDVVEHLHTPKVLFSSVQRALRSGGKLIVGVPFLYWIHEEPRDFHRYTRFALGKMTEDAGLDVISITAYAGAPEVMSDIAVKALGSRPRLARLIYVLTRAMLKLSLVKKLSEATKTSMPLGYVLVAQKPTGGDKN
jgi:SAM-dependent methyltransferase